MVVAAKPFLPVDDQIELLKSRGMIIADEDIARRCLRRIGYYRLSAYWYPFRSMLLGPLALSAPASSLRLDTFVPGTTFEAVFDFYVFDKQLRNLLLDGLERIEIAMRAIIAELLGARDPRAHRDPTQLDGDFARKIDKYTGQPKHQDWLRKQDGHFARSREDFAEHFRARYPSHVPPIWIACEVWEWGMLSHFFAGMKQVDKDHIAGKFGALNGRQLESWLRAMNDVRNICAHHSRLWNRGLKVIPALPAVGAMPELDHVPRNNQSLSRVYTVLVLMRILHRHIHPSLSDWHKRVARHALSASVNPIISAASAGFPADWEKEAVWS
jgi:abortive infection bacteriophage resistance protein